MKLNIVRQDGQILLIERKNPGLFWGLLFPVLPLVIVESALHTGRLSFDPFNLYHVLSLLAIALASIVAIFCIPYRETMTLDHDAQALVIVRKKLTGTIRKEVRFADVRAVRVIVNANSYHFSLETDDGKIRFPFVSVPIPAKNPNFIGHGEEDAAELRVALGLPAKDRPLTAQLSGGRSGCSLTVLQRDSDALVMEDSVPAILAVPAIIFALIMGVMLALNWLNSLPWKPTCWVGGISGVIALVFTLFYPYRSHYVFDRIGRRLLVLRKRVYRTTCKETSYDQIRRTELYLMRGKEPRYFLRLVTTGIWKIDLTPTSYPFSLDGQYRSFAIIEEMVKEALGLDHPERGEPHHDREAELEVAGVSPGSQH